MIFRASWLWNRIPIVIFLISYKFVIKFLIKLLYHKSLQEEIVMIFSNPSKKITHIINASPYSIYHFPVTVLNMLLHLLREKEIVDIKFQESRWLYNTKTYEYNLLPLKLHEKGYYEILLLKRCNEVLSFHIKKIMVEL